MRDAKVAPEDRVLFGIKSIHPHYEVSASLTNILTEDEVKAKFELTLRRNNVPIDYKSGEVVRADVEALLFDNGTAVCYETSLMVDESQLVFRNGECYRMSVRVWEKGGSFGTVGKNKASETIVNSIEKDAEIFANDFLSAKQTQQEAAK